MKLWSEIEKTSFEHWMNNFDTASAPNGESFQSLYDRVIDFYDNEVSHVDYEAVAIVTHGGVIRSIINHILNIPLKNAFSYELDFGSVTLIDKNDDWAKVKYLNR
jgi:alpha-ribazole phosphatase